MPIKPAKESFSPEEVREILQTNVHLFKEEAGFAMFLAELALYLAHHTAHEGVVDLDEPTQRLILVDGASLPPDFDHRPTQEAVALPRFLNGPSDRIPAAQAHAAGYGPTPIPVPPPSAPFPQAPAAAIPSTPRPFVPPPAPVRPAGPMPVRPSTPPPFRPPAGPPQPQRPAPPQGSPGPLPPPMGAPRPMPQYAQPTVPPRPGTQPLPPAVPQRAPIPAAQAQTPMPLRPGPGPGPAMTGAPLPPPPALNSPSSGVIRVERAGLMTPLPTEGKIPGPGAPGRDLNVANLGRTKVYRVVRSYKSASAMEAPCPVCGTMVPIESKQCHGCGHMM